MANLQGWHLIILLVVILLLFGAAKLPLLRGAWVSRPVRSSTR